MLRLSSRADGGWVCFKTTIVFNLPYNCEAQRSACSLNVAELGQKSVILLRSAACLASRPPNFEIGGVQFRGIIMYNGPGRDTAIHHKLNSWRILDPEYFPMYTFSYFPSVGFHISSLPFLDFSPSCVCPARRLAVTYRRLVSVLKVWDFKG
jgi:hypothetical protein